MPLTFEEITEREDALRQEITEREHLLAAYQLILSDRARPIGAVSALALAAQAVHCLPDRAEPAPAPVVPKMHPELAALHGAGGGIGDIVQWAIQQMTEDYGVNDLHRRLEREGWWITSAQISVVLTRLKRRGVIEEIRSGGGRTPSIFRKPESATAQEPQATDQTGDIDRETELPTAA